MMGWLSRWRAHREARAVQRRAIPDALWDLTVARMPFIQRRPPEDLAELRRLASLFLDQKEFAGAGGLVIDDGMALSIAVQACLPVLRFGLAPYSGFVGIVVHPDEVLARREEALALLAAPPKADASMVWFGRVYPGSLAHWLAWFWWGGFPANLGRLGPAWARSTVHVAREAARGRR